MFFFILGTTTSGRKEGWKDHVAPKLTLKLIDFYENEYWKIWIFIWVQQSGTRRKNTASLSIIDVFINWHTDTRLEHVGMTRKPLQHCSSLSLVSVFFYFHFLTQPQAWSLILQPKISICIVCVSLGWLTSFELRLDFCFFPPKWLLTATREHNQPCYFNQYLAEKMYNWMSGIRTEFSTRFHNFCFCDPNRRTPYASVLSTD